MTRRFRTWRGRTVAVTAGLAVLVGCSGPDNAQNSLDPKGESARKILDLFTPVFWVAVVVLVGVVAAIIFAVVRYRERPGNEQPKQTHGNTLLEIGWTVVPLLILLVIAVPTVRTIADLDERPAGDDVLEVIVTGKQWWWQYEYAEQTLTAGKGFVTANELHIPVDTKVDLKLRACDEGPAEGSCNVAHSFWVPALAGKRDVIPGRENRLTISADQTGTFLGQCAEYCGLSHANMRLRVMVEERDDFDAWVAGQQRSGPELTETVVDKEGEETQEPVGQVEALVGSTFGCTTCHSFTDPAIATFGPNLAHLAGRSTIAGATLELSRENLVEWVMDAPGMKPMEAQFGCPSSELACVGMPSFSEHVPEGRAPMTRRQAEQIADFLLTLE